MFIYAGLIASMAMASQSSPTLDQSLADPVLQPIVVDAPMHRNDI